MSLEKIKLFNVPRNTWIKVYDEGTGELDDYPIFFHHVDGMYSLCSTEEEIKEGNTVHLAAWTEVVVCRK